MTVRYQHHKIERTMSTAGCFIAVFFALDVLASTKKHFVMASRSVFLHQSRLLTRRSIYSHSNKQLGVTGCAGLPPDHTALLEMQKGKNWLLDLGCSR